jgi:hypothetical protein
LIDLFKTIFRKELELDDLVCGRPTLQSSQYIYGGESSIKGAWPWLVALHKWSGEQVDFLCGGSLVSNVRKVFYYYIFFPKFKFSNFSAKSHFNITIGFFKKLIHTIKSIIRCNF